MAVDDLSKKIDFFEVKCDASRFNKTLLQRKVAEFFTVAGDLAEYKMRCSCLSVDDM